MNVIKERGTLKMFSPFFLVILVYNSLSSYYSHFSSQFTYNPRLVNPSQTKALQAP